MYLCLASSKLNFEEFMTKWNRPLQKYTHIILHKVNGAALCFVSFKNRAVTVEFYILPGSCDSILDGNKAEQLKIISLDKDDHHIFNPVLMILSQEKDGEFISNICSILQHYPQNFKGLRKLRNYQVKLYTDNSIKLVAVPPRSVPYHLKGRVSQR